MSTFKDVYEKVTAQIIEAIENGTAEFRMPWHSLGKPLYEPVNVLTKKTYRGVNVITLWAAAETAGYGTGCWATYKQWQQLGAQVKKGESGTCVVLWKTIERDEEPIDEEETKDKRLLARGFSVFNAEQVEGYRVAEMPRLSEKERIERADDFYQLLGAEIKHGGNRAFYSITKDEVVMPPFDVFVSPISYYATLAHEITHWSGAESRLARGLTGDRNTEAYVMEELVAELGAAFLCARLDLAPERRLDHAAYIDRWLQVLKQDKRAIFTAASKAQRACDWLCGMALALANAA